MKVHYPKLYNMAHLFSLNVFTASKGYNNYILFNWIKFLEVYLWNICGILLILCLLLDIPLVLC